MILLLQLTNLIIYPWQGWFMPKLKRESELLNYVCHSIYQDITTSVCVTNLQNILWSDKPVNKLYVFDTLSGLFLKIRSIIVLLVLEILVGSLIIWCSSCLDVTALSFFLVFVQPVYIKISKYKSLSKSSKFW